MPKQITYVIRCTTDNVWERTTLTSDQAVPTTCPTNGGHTIDSTQTHVDEIVYTPDFISVDAETGTASTDYAEKTSITFDAEDGGDFEFEWYAEIKSTNIRARVMIRIQLDDTTNLGEPDENPDTADQVGWGTVKGFAQELGLSSGTHTLDMDFASSLNGKSVKIRRARLKATRIGE